MVDQDRVRVAIEATPKRAFATAVDWPGWSRGAKTPAAALDALAAYRDRYAAGIAPARVGVPPAHPELEIVEEIEGNASTEFGVPGTVAAADRAPLDGREAERRAALVAAAWATFERVAGSAPTELRKGPRGGGRDTAKIVAHVVASDAGYQRELGLRLPEPDPTDARAVGALHDAMLAVLRRPSNGQPIVKRWTTRYAAHRIGWHSLDHAWEIEDRSS
ncbi:MAG TPA: hypothetical protein VKR30_09130 [Candidatus Limnocylindrales bacterium]|nr:hypothetical protein [Candidatus Limnocylindrales bacterium]